MTTTALQGLQPEAGPTSPASELEIAFARLRAASRSAPVVGYDQRIAALTALDRAVRSRKETAVSAISEDFGHRSRTETLFVDVFAVTKAIGHAKEHLREWMEDEERKTSWLFMPAVSTVRRRALGVVGILAPWNYPVQLALCPLVGALAAGNRALVKPSERTPRTASWLAEVVKAALPPDLAAVIQGGPDVGDAFAHLPFDHLFFTGSTEIGKRVMKAASENLVPVTLELGGKSPAVVGPDAALAQATARIVAGKMVNGGQTCVAPDYALVPAGLREAFVLGCRRATLRAYPKFAGNPDVTTIISDRHYARLRALLSDAVARGATVVALHPDASGAADVLARERRMCPTLVLDPTADMLCMKEEIFGPVLPVVSYDSLEGAIAYVNDRPRPLALYYFGRGRAAAQRVVAETASGGVTINETLLHAFQDDLPFGGVGASGMGHYRGVDGFRALTQAKAVFEQGPVSGTSFLRPPFGRLATIVLRFVVGR